MKEIGSKIGEEFGVMFSFWSSSSSQFYYADNLDSYYGGVDYDSKDNRYRVRPILNLN